MQPETEDKYMKTAKLNDTFFQDVDLLTIRAARVEALPGLDVIEEPGRINFSIALQSTVENSTTNIRENAIVEGANVDISDITSIFMAVTAKLREILGTEFDTLEVELDDGDVVLYTGEE